MRGPGVSSALPATPRVSGQGSWQWQRRQDCAEVGGCSASAATRQACPLWSPAGRGSLGKESVAPCCGRLSPCPSSSSSCLSPPSVCPSTWPPTRSDCPVQLCVHHPDVCPSPWELCSAPTAGGLGGAQRGSSRWRAVDLLGSRVSKTPPPDVGAGRTRTLSSLDSIG